LEALAGRNLNNFVMVVKLVQLIFLDWAALISIVNLMLMLQVELTTFTMVVV
jgi:hypothetical protein